MKWHAKRLVSSVALGVLLAGPLAALGLVAAPAAWRGPAIPGGVLACTILFVVLFRRTRDPPR